MGTSAESLNSKLGLDTGDFKLGLQTADRELRILESGFRASVSTLDDWANSISGVELRQKSLTSQIDLQKMKVEALRAEHQRQVEANGEMSITAQNAEIKLNKETVTLGKMQTELAGTEPALENLKNGLDASGKSTEDLEDKQKSFGEQFKSSWTEINSMIGVAKQAYQILKGAVDETVGAFVKYADQVREISQVTGQQAEEVSRLIQLTDDYKIKTDSLNTVMKKMAADGLPLTIDSLATLSDEYLKLAPGTERQLFLTKEFGKAGVDFAEIMLAGGEAIKSQAAAIKGGLVLTQAGLDKAREYELAQNELTDSWEAFKISIGEAVTPTLTSILSLTNLQLRAGELGITLVENNGTYKTYAVLLADVTLAEKTAAAQAENYTGRARQAQEAIAGLGTSTAITKTQTDMFGFSVLDAAAALQQEQAEFGFIINFAKQYETNIKNVHTAESDLKTAQDELFALGAPGWSHTATEVQTAQEKVDGLKAKLAEAQQASLNATNEMIAGFLQAQLTADGSFTEEDIQKVLAYRLSVGLLTQEAYSAALNALHIAENLAKVDGQTFQTTLVTNYLSRYGTIEGRQAGRQGVINDGQTVNWVASGGPVRGGSYIWNEDPSTSPEVFVGSAGGYILTKQDAMNALGGQFVRQLEGALRDVSGSVGTMANPGSGVVNNSTSSRIYNITNAGIDAAELDRIQRRQELLRGN